MLETPGKKQRQSAARKMKMALERTKSIFLVVTKPHKAASRADRVAPEGRKEEEAPAAAAAHKDDEVNERKATAASTKATCETPTPALLRVRIVLVAIAESGWLPHCWCWSRCIM